ncbi:hypothetical protein TrRE_jg8411 [Triparma retinervis]|uniref:Uncharacterized protein n=1 Tax=Triparma retinervis TaxID=2557542 RepID=A0A9W7DZ05_9STRA|nr:hypothetical protein TrRE_jg8411 [Triparma retinervis]
MLFLSTLLLLSAAAATSPPQVLIKTSYSNGKFEAHPHSGVELVSGGFFMVGDSMTTGDGDTFRQQFAVKTASDGTEDWQVALGDVGYNYGKFGVELSDKTLLVFGSSSISDGSGSYSELRSIHRLDPEDGAVISHTVLPSKFGSGNDGFMGADLMTSDSDGLSVWATGYVGGEGQPEDEEAMFLIGGGSAFAMQLQFPSVSGKDKSEDAKVLWENVFSQDDDGFKMNQGMRIVETSEGDAILISTATPDEGLYQWSSLALTPKGEIKWRMVRIDAKGNVLWDARFKPENSPDDHNVECYGVDSTLDGGYIATCGFGCMPETCKRLQPAENRIWQVLAHRVDKNGEQVWDELYTDTAKGNNAGEYIVSLREGGYAIYVDASWGDADTGGNFGLMVLDSDVE